MQDWQPYPVDPYSCYMCDQKSLLLLVHCWYSSSVDLGGSIVLRAEGDFFYSGFPNGNRENNVK